MPGQGLQALTRARLLVVPLVAAAAFAVLALPVPAGTGPQVLPALALTVFTVGLWATGSLPEYITAVVFFILALALGIAPPQAVLSGFWSSAFWLVAGGVVIGVAADRTGLGRFLAHAFVRRLSASYPRLITGIVLGAVVLAFLIPAAIGRLIILMPIILSLADKLGFGPGTRGRTGMVLATTMGSFFIPLTILPANLPNVVLAGVADSLYGLKITYGAYLLMNFPVLGALKALVLVVVICFFFNDSIADPAADVEKPRLSPEGWRLALIVGVTLAVWATDFVHGIEPGWVAVVAALICVLPGVGVIKAADFPGISSFQILLFVAAVLALGNVVATSGAGALIADKLLALTDFQPGGTGYAYGVFSAMSMAMSLFSTLPGSIVVIAPFAAEVAEASGLPLLAVLMIIINGFSTVIFPYQGGPILVGLRLGGATLMDGLRVTLPVALITVAALLPLQFFWWRWLSGLT